LARLLRRIARLTGLTRLLRRITRLARIAGLLRRIAARLTGLRERLGESLDLATEGVNSLGRETLEASLLDGSVDLTCVEGATAVSIGSEESVGQLLEHLMQSNVLVEVDALSVVTTQARALVHDQLRIRKPWFAATLLLTDRRP
jgi:hypothetical protein